MGRLRLAIGLSVSLVLLGCSGRTFDQRGPNDRVGGMAEGAQPYLSSQEVSAISIPPPPAPGSRELLADEELLHSRHGGRTQEDCVMAEATFFVDFRFLWGDKCPFVSPLPREIVLLFNRVDSGVGGASRLFKERFARPRPIETNPCAGASSRGRRGGFSYPSTHAALARTFALVLADLVPERREEFLARADVIAGLRVAIGVHYPSDIAGGYALADEYHDALNKNEKYALDIDSARGYLVVQEPSTVPRQDHGIR